MEIKKKLGYLSNWTPVVLFSHQDFKMIVYRMKTIVFLQWNYFTEWLIDKAVEIKWMLTSPSFKYHEISNNCSGKNPKYLHSPFLLVTWWAPKLVTNERVVGVSCAWGKQRLQKSFLDRFKNIKVLYKESKMNFTRSLRRRKEDNSDKFMLKKRQKLTKVRFDANIVFSLAWAIKYFEPPEPPPFILPYSSINAKAA